MNMYRVEHSVSGVVVCDLYAISERAAIITAATVIGMRPTRLDARREPDITDDIDRAARRQLDLTSTLGPILGARLHWRRAHQIARRDTRMNRYFDSVELD